MGFSKITVISLVALGVSGFRTDLLFKKAVLRELVYQPDKWNFVGSVVKEKGVLVVDFVFRVERCFQYITKVVHIAATSNKHVDIVLCGIVIDMKMPRY